MTMKPRPVRRRPLLLDQGAADPPTWMRLLLGLLFAGGAAALGVILVQAPERAPILPELVAAHLDETGVSNPITAVLLNFRTYDTLLELAVLVVAMVAVWSMDREHRDLTRAEAQLADPVLEGLARVVVPLAGTTALYLTWAGGHGTGGAFQAGALLAGAGVLLVAAGFLAPPTAAIRPVRVLAAGSIYLFVGAGFGVLPWTGAFLAYPDGWAYPLILGLEAALMVSVAVVLVELFVDVPAVPDPDPRLERIDPTGDPLGRIVDPEGALQSAGATPDASRDASPEASPGTSPGATSPAEGGS